MLSTCLFAQQNKHRLSVQTSITLATPQSFRSNSLSKTDAYTFKSGWLPGLSIGLQYLYFLNNTHGIGLTFSTASHRETTVHKYTAGKSASLNEVSSYVPSLYLDYNYNFINKKNTIINTTSSIGLEYKSSAGRQYGTGMNDPETGEIIYSIDLQYGGDQINFRPFIGFRLGGGVDQRIAKHTFINFKIDYTFLPQKHYEDESTLSITYQGETEITDANRRLSYFQIGTGLKFVF